MDDLPVIPAPPTVIPAVSIPEKVFDRLWVTELLVTAPSPASPVACRIVAKKYSLSSGEPEFSPIDEPITLAYDNLLYEAGRDSELAGVVGSLLSYVAKQYGNKFSVDTQPPVDADPN